MRARRADLHSAQEESQICCCHRLGDTPSFSGPYADSPLLRTHVVVKSGQGSPQPRPTCPAVPWPRWAYSLIFRLPPAADLVALPFRAHPAAHTSVVSDFLPRLDELIIDIRYTFDCDCTLNLLALYRRVSKDPTVSRESHLPPILTAFVLPVPLAIRDAEGVQSCMHTSCHQGGVIS